mmetsp:Transcript_22286/g.54986  ORF Transcript_22286/g.54986 Transcript_22286/m.54986 type:complete len:227 (+) Transcript_22286:100-780(+)
MSNTHTHPPIPNKRLCGFHQRRISVSTTNTDTPTLRPARRLSRPLRPLKHSFWHAKTIFHRCRCLSPFSGPFHSAHPKGVYMNMPSGTPSFFLYKIFSFAFVKSACVTCMRLSRSASRPASVHSALMSAPDSSSLPMTNSSSLTSSAIFMRPVCMPKMWRLVFTSGSGNSILRSMRPGRSRAGSSDSIRFVAMITLTSACASKPSICVRSSIIVRWISFSPPELES